MDWIRKKWIAASSAAVLTAVVGVKAYENYQLQQHRLENQRIADELMQMEFSDEFDTMECSADPLDASKLVFTLPPEDVTVSMYPESIDLSKPGNRSVNFFLEYKDDLQEKHRKQIAKSITVQDTAKPVIDARKEKVELWQYASFDVADYITSVKDEVSGELAKADELAPGKYTVESNVDTDTPGNYTVNIKAQDLHGNTEESSFEVAVYQQPARQTYNNAGYSGGYSGYSGYSGQSYAYSGGGGGFSGYSYADGNSMDTYQDYQSAVDAGYITRVGDDYFHHNDSAFMNQFWNTSAGDTITLNGQSYTVTGVEHGHVGANDPGIYTDSGAAAYGDGSTDLITCDGNGDQRWIMHLQENGN